MKKLLLLFLFYLTFASLYSQEYYDKDFMSGTTNELLAILNKNIAIDKEHLNLRIEYHDSNTIIISGTERNKNKCYLSCVDYDILNPVINFKFELKNIDNSTWNINVLKMTHSFVSGYGDVSWLPKKKLNEVRDELVYIKMNDIKFDITENFVKYTQKLEGEIIYNEQQSSNMELKKKERKKHKREYEKLKTEYTINNKIIRHCLMLITRFKIYYIYEK